MKILKLGKMVTDTITKTTGMLTHLIIAMGGNQEYIFQPHGLNPKNHKPVDTTWLTKDRIAGLSGDEPEFEELDVPLELLGTQAEDTASGFKGSIIMLVYHINGCMHASLKPEGVVKETGATIDPCDFDIRRLAGEKIKPLEEKELKQSIKQTPSPIDIGVKKY